MDESQKENEYSGYEVCHYCFGQGQLPNEGYADCPYCDGTGFEPVYDYDDEPDYICEICGADCECK